MRFFPWFFCLPLGALIGLAWGEAQHLADMRLHAGVFFWDFIVLAGVAVFLFAAAAPFLDRGKP